MWQPQIQCCCSRNFERTRGHHFLYALNDEEDENIILVAKLREHTNLKAMMDSATGFISTLEKLKRLKSTSTFLNELNII